MRKIRFSSGVLAGSVMVVFGVFGAPHPGHTTRAKATPAAKGILSLPPQAQASISAALGRDLPAYQIVRLTPKKQILRSAELRLTARADSADSRPTTAIFAARNARNKLVADFTAQGVTVRSGAARWRMALAGYGYGRDLKAVAATDPTAKANRVEYRRGGLTEWYVNGPMGLEQGFTFEQPPNAEHRVPNSSTLTLALALSGDLTAKMDPHGKALTLSGPAYSPSLRYAGLTATDASGNPLPASLELRGHELLLKVNDAGARYPLTIDPFVQLAELTASDGMADDDFGFSAAFSGSTVVVGAPQFTRTGTGAAYVFVKPPSGWQNMFQTAKLTASDGLDGDDLGISVAITGDTVVVGAEAAAVDGDFEQGKAYVFVEPPTGWADMTETAELTASDGTQEDFFGSSVAVDGSTIIVGASDWNLAEGKAYVFVEPAGGWKTTSTFRAELTAYNGMNSEDFGASVSISGNTVAIGALVGTWRMFS